MAGASSQPRSAGVYRPSTKLTWSFAVTTVLQAVICLALEGYVFGKFTVDLNDANVSSNAQSKVITVYLALFIFGFFYQLFLVYFALKARNTIQIIALCAYNGVLLIYSAIQIDQIRDALQGLSVNGLGGDDLWDQVKGYLIAVPVILGVGSVIMSGLAWKLHEEFAWTIYKNVSADLRLKRRFFIYQVYIALLQLDWFFFIGFTVQFLVVVTGTTLAEKILTIIALPATMIVLIFAYFVTKRENTVGQSIVILLYFAALAYFLFKVIRMYFGPAVRVAAYLPIRKSLTIFAILTIILLLGTISNAIWCMLNFNKGLKPILNKSSRSSDPEAKMAYDQDISMATNRPGTFDSAPGRMTID